MLNTYEDERSATLQTIKYLIWKRLQAKIKMDGQLVHDFLFKDDFAFNAASETKMQQSMDQFSAACANFGLTINMK